MTDEIAQLLKSLRLGRVAEILDDELKNADKEHLSYQEFVVRLLRAQWHHQQQSALAWRIERAKLPEKWSLESFPWKRQPGISQRQMRSFAELPATCIKYVRRIEELVGCPVALLSTSPEREDTILMTDPFRD